MIGVFITIFIAALIGVSLIGPLSTQVGTAAQVPVYNSSNSSQLLIPGSSLYNASSWGSTVLKLIPGFYALIILGVVIAGLYTVFRQAGVV